MKNVVIDIKNLKKEFKLPVDRQNSIKSKLINFRTNNYKTQTSLKDVSLEVYEGEFLGIVGRNGSGKSTLLKLISGIYTPTSGTIEVVGKLTPFIELGVGFSPELSGRDNVYLNGSLLGFSRSQMDAMYQEIVEFAELGEFMDQKLKNYSSGMQVRLAFSIAIKVNSDILVLDEVLAVGDAAFQQKCFDYFMDLKSNKKTVVLVTHDMGAVRQYCDRAIMIEDGVVAYQGTPEKVAAEYHKLFIEEISKSNDQKSSERDRWGTGDVEVTDTRVTVSKDYVKIKTKYTSKKYVSNAIFGISIFSPTDINLIDANTYQKKKRTGDLRPGDEIDIVWEVPNLFTRGVYRVSTGCTNSSFSKTFDQLPYSGSFRITDEVMTGALIYPQVKMSEFKVTS